MSKANVAVVVLLAVGALCAAAAVYKHLDTPVVPPPYVTSPQSVTGDANPADAAAWDALTTVIDTQRCDQRSLDTLAAQTHWNKVLDEAHRRTVADIQAGKAALAQYRVLGGDVLADQHKRMEQGRAIIRQMVDRSRASTMRNFVDFENDLSVDEATLQSAQKDELDTLDKLLDSAQSALQGGDPRASDNATWSGLMAALQQQQASFIQTRFNENMHEKILYGQLDNLVGRRPNFSYGQFTHTPVYCETDAIHTSSLAEVDQQAQQILAR
jgi:hypothetical protein